MRHKAIILHVLFILILSSSCRQAEPQANDNLSKAVPIRLGVFPRGVQAPMFLIAKKHRFLEKHGLQPTFYQFGLLPAMTQAFLAGKTDVIWVGVTQAADMRNKGVPVKIVLAHAAAAERVVVRAQSPFRSLSDLKGKKIGTPGAGTTAHTLFMLIAKENYKLDPARDFQTLKASEDNMALYLMRGELDAAILKVETFAAMDNGQTRVISVLSDEWKKLNQSDTPFILLSSTFREEYVRDHPDAVRRYILGMQEANVYASTHQAEVAQLLATEFSMPLVAAQRYLVNWNQIYFCELGPGVRDTITKEWQRMTVAGDLTAVPENIFRVFPEAERVSDPRTGLAPR